MLELVQSMRQRRLDPATQDAVDEDQGNTPSRCNDANLLQPGGQGATQPIRPLPSVASGKVG